jgi:predicted nucleotidyltransferase
MNMLALSTRVQPQPGELAKAQSHLMTVRRRLSTSFDISKFVRIGSHARGTAIRRYSDVDILAVLRRNEAKWGGSIVNSSTFLRRIRNDLEDRYASTEVRGDGQAVVAQFGSGEHALDVVPAIFQKWDGNRPIYLIPDGQDSWIETSPETHNAYFAAASEKSGQKLRKVVQLVKWWKYSRSQPMPLEAFHVDLLLASSGLCIGVKSYGECLLEAFKLLAERECRGFRDPLGISGVVLATKTESQRQALSESVNFAVFHARKAIAAESWKDFAEANRQWAIVFNGEY